MSIVKYYLDNDNILLSYYYDGKVVRLSLQEKIDRKHWDSKKYRARYTYKHADKLNRLLDNLVMFVQDTRIEYKVKGERLTHTHLKELIKVKVFGSESNTFKDYSINIFLQDKKTKVKAGTLKAYTNAINVVNKYIPDLMFDKINRVTCLNLEKSMKASGASVNYINKVFKIWKDCIHSAYVDGIHDNKYYQSKSFVPPTESVDNVYLTLNELDIIYNALPGMDAKLKNAAIIFLIGCYTGQRHQTYSDINKGLIYEVDGVKMISIRQSKTNVTVSIPVSDKLMSLLNMEYHKISRQKLSDYIKIVCKNAGINKYDDVSTHTARRSFATNMVLAGVDVTKIMKITGHKTEKEFRSYVKIDSLQNAINVSDQINKIIG
jgi:integrase